MDIYVVTNATISDNFRVIYDCTDIVEGELVAAECSLCGGFTMIKADTGEMLIDGIQVKAEPRRLRTTLRAVGGEFEITLMKVRNYPSQK